LQSITGGGGYHLFFKYPGGKLKGKLGAGIDVKSDGGFVAAPPSVHPETKKHYEWRNDSDIADMPSWMLDLLTQVAIKRETVENIPEGERNETLFKIGAALKGSKSARQIETALLEENLIRCVPPLPDEEIHAIAAKISAYESNLSFKTRWQKAITRDATLSAYRRFIILALSIDYMDENGRNCYPAMETLAIDLHVSRTALSNALEAAIECGWLERYRRPKPKHSTGKQKWSYGYIAKIKKP